MSADETVAGDLCEQILLRMSCALDGVLAENEMAELSAHLVACARCLVRAVELADVDRLLRSVKSQSFVRTLSHADFVREVMARVRLESIPVGSFLEFTSLVAQDPALQSQFRLAASMESFVKLFVNVGWRHGYRFGSGEVVNLLTARRAANDDLSDEQLDAVVGGVGPNSAALHAFLGDVLQNWFKPPV